MIEIENISVRLCYVHVCLDPLYTTSKVHHGYNEGREY
jgi:hypothetical protein